MVKSSASSTLLNSSSPSKRTRIELFDLKLFITKPTLFYKPKFIKSSKVKIIKSTKLSKLSKSSSTSSSSTKVQKSKLSKPIKSTKSKVTYNYQKIIKNTTVTSSSANTTATTASTLTNSNQVKNNNIVYLNNTTFNNSGTSYFSGSSVVLTTESTDRIGSVFTKDLLDIEESFNIEFSYTMETNGTDGLALVIHNNQSTQNPFEFYRLLEGGQLEYNSNSEGGILAVEFKTILNDDVQVPSCNCITIKSSVESVNSLTNTVHTYNFTNNINYNNTNNVIISYNSNTSQLSLTLNNNLVLNNINIPKLLHKGFIGFVAATGFCIQKQQINNCKITILN